MKGFAKFQAAMIAAAQVHLRPLLEEHRKAAGEALFNDVFDLDGPTMVSRKLTDKDRFFAKTFRGFSEIGKSLETLEDISFYIGRFPFPKTRITPSRYLRFHVEAWFAEVYVLQERLERYLKVTERQHKSHLHSQTIRAQFRILDDRIKNTLKSVINIRGQHIHEVRFSDDDIDRIGTIELLTLSSDDKFAGFMHGHQRIEYRKARKIWKDRIVAGNEAVRKLLDVFCDALFPVVFDDTTNAFKYPEHSET